GEHSNCPPLWTAKCGVHHVAPSRSRLVQFAINVTHRTRRPAGQCVVPGPPFPRWHRRPSLYVGGTGLRACATDGLLHTGGTPVPPKCSFTRAWMPMPPLGCFNQAGGHWCDVFGRSRLRSPPMIPFMQRSSGSDKVIRV